MVVVRKRACGHDPAGACIAVSLLQTTSNFRGELIPRGVGRTVHYDTRAPLAGLLKRLMKCRERVVLRMAQRHREDERDQTRRDEPHAASLASSKQRHTYDQQQRHRRSPARTRRATTAPRR